MMLSGQDLCMGYDQGLVLRDLNFQVSPGETLGILGPNGSGKTTLLRCINSILKPSQGAVLVQGRNVLGLKGDEIAKKLGYVAQKAEIGRMTAFDAILLGRRPYLGWRVTPRDLRIVNAAIKRMGLEHLSLRHLDQMSGGELQKVCIARALVQEPLVMLLDEPTSSLDLKNQMEILDTIGYVVAEHQLAAVMTMHDLSLALRFADKFLLLREGRIYHHGKKSEISPDMVQEVYGVKVDILEHQGHLVVVPQSPRQPGSPA